jgi:hypothetical protein
MNVCVLPASKIARLGQLDPARLRAANINPTTGLATDYLNHFNEAIMLLELLPEMPDCVEDLKAWRPLSYPEHFAASNFKDRELAIAAYDLAEPERHRRLDEIAAAMDAILTSTIETMGRSDATHTDALVSEAAFRLKHLVAMAGAVINGADAAGVASAETEANQAAVDALLDR